MTAHTTPDQSESIKTFMEAARAGLWGLVATALHRDGGINAVLATEHALASGQAFIDIRFQFQPDRIVTSAKYCSHGAEQQLFSVVMSAGQNTDHAPG